MKGSRRKLDTMKVLSRETCWLVCDVRKIDVAGKDRLLHLSDEDGRTLALFREWTFAVYVDTTEPEGE